MSGVTRDHPISGASDEHLTELEVASLLVADPIPPLVREHTERCARCRALIEQARAVARQFELVVLPRTLPAIRERASANESWLTGWFPPRLVLPVLAFAAVAIVLVVVRPSHRPTTSAHEPLATAHDPRTGARAPVPHVRPLESASAGTATPDTVAYKGGRSVQVHARRGDRIWQLADGAEVAPGDALRFVIEPAGARHVLIVSRDGAGVHTVYYPFGGDQSAPLAPGTAVELADSVVLDDVPGAEALYVFLTDQPLTLADALTATDARAQPGRAQVGALAMPGAVPLVFHLTKRPLADAQKRTTP